MHMDEEVDFIYSRFAKHNRTAEQTGILSLKAKIKQVLEFHKKDLMDFPFIAYHRSTEYLPDLRIEDIWRIAELDKEFIKIVKLKEVVEGRLSKIEDLLDRREVEFLRNCYKRYFEVYQLLDIENYLVYLCQLHDVEEKRSGQAKPVRKSELRNFKDSCIIEFARLFSLPSHLFIQKLEISSQEDPYYKRLYPPTPVEEPGLLAENYKERTNSKEALEILKEVCAFLAKELAKNPYIKNTVRNKVYPYITVSTKPTEVGKKELDPFHSDYRTKRILRKPIDKFDDDLFMAISECRKRQLIEVIVDVPDEVIKIEELRLGEAYTDSNSNESWNLVRLEVIALLVNKMLIPELRKEVEEFLIQKAEDCVIARASAEFGRLLMLPPYRSNINNDSGIGRLIYERTVPVVMSLAFDRERMMVGCAVVDRTGETIHSQIFQQICKKNIKTLQNDGQKFFTEEIDMLTDIISKTKPALIVIGANHLLVRNVKDIITEHCIDKAENLEVKPWVTYGDITIPLIYASYKPENLIDTNEEPIVRTAASLARLKQNPMAEILNLWHSDARLNNCLKINLHPLQNCVSKQKLFDMLELEAQKWVNSVGVELKKVYDKPHLVNMLTFVSGLGPRKAKFVIDKLKVSTNITMRINLIAADIVGKIVFMNSCAFLNFSEGLEYFSANKSFYNDFNILDSTRIHPEFYPLAQKFAKNASGFTNKDENSCLKACLLDPNLLDNIDFNKQNEASRRLLLQEIKKELAFPYKDTRDRHKDIDSKDLFFLLINEDPDRFYKGVIVTARTVDCEDQHVRCILNNGLEAYVWIKDIFEDNEKTDLNVMRQRFIPNHVFEGRLKEINESKFKADLTVRPSEMRSHKTFKRMANLDTYFNVIAEEDDINYKYNQDVKKDQRSFRKRDIHHPYFKNIKEFASIELMETKKVGDFIFRPTSGSLNSIYLVFKFYEKCISNILIEELDKSTPTSLGKRLVMMGEEYSSLQEIIERFCLPAKDMVLSVVKHRKFIDSKGLKDFENLLKKLKEKTPGNIIYNLTVVQARPQYFFFGYLHKSNNPKIEFIKLKPRGLFFHDKYFKDINSVLDYFKNNFKTEEYRQFVKNTKLPEYVYNVKQPEPQNTFDAFKIDEDEGLHLGRKRDRDDWVDEWQNKNDKRGEVRSCYTCGKEGHLSKECSMGGKSARSCYVCSKEGHFAKDCPQGGQGERKCFKCSNEGHFAKDCPQASSVKCYSCSQEGHLSKDCPKNERVGGSGFSGNAILDYNPNGNNTSSGWGQESSGWGQESSNWGWGGNK